ncbi:hypothetical protein [Polyangium aurulentum]|uniref:hypothetical protein n=1 Tax=Polyangium aurulentum TaxID=2567896 RepID=UPI00146BC32F|nr:hypothetical protein [Polyangium aurulentum]UQA61452.1 hypothetical protein E8A73_013645 [Polyangium aurulentum]
MAIQTMRNHHATQSAPVSIRETFLDAAHIGTPPDAGIRLLAAKRELARYRWA